MKVDIPFNNGKWNINCKTVGEVIDALSRLPRDFPVKSSSDSVELVIFDRNREDAHLGFEHGDWDIDDDEED